MTHSHTKTSCVVEKGAPFRRKSLICYPYTHLFLFNILLFFSFEFIFLPTIYVLRVPLSQVVVPQLSPACNTWQTAATQLIFTPAVSPTFLRQPSLRLTRSFSCFYSESFQARLMGFLLRKVPLKEGNSSFPTPPLIS